MTDEQLPTVSDRPKERQNADELWTASDAAAFLKVTERTVGRYRLEVGLPYVMLPAGAIRYEPEAVKAWARGENSAESTQGAA